MTSNSNYNFENPFPGHFPVIAGRINRFERVVMKTPSLLSILAEGLLRVRGVPAVQHNAPSHFPAFEILTAITIASICIFFLNPLLAIGMGVTNYFVCRSIAALDASANYRIVQELLNRFSNNEIDLLADSAVAYSHSHSFQKILKEIEGDSDLQNEFYFFAENYFKHASALTNYSNSLILKTSIDVTLLPDLVAALLFFFASDDTYIVKQARVSHFKSLNSLIKKLRLKHDCNCNYSFT